MRTELEEEFCEFVNAHRERLRGYAYLLCGDWHRADDLTQKALIKVYAAWPRVSKTGVHSYVRRTVLNTFLTENRRFWRKREYSSQTTPEPTVIGADPDIRVAVMAALKRLPPRQRATVVLRFWEDLSVAETAETMRCSTGTVKSQLAKAVRTLRAMLPNLDPNQLKEPAYES